MKLHRKQQKVINRVGKKLCGEVLRKVPVLHDDETIAEARELMCHANVLRKVAKYGGRLVLGWEVRSENAHSFGAGGHYVWETPDKELICVSPTNYGEKEEHIYFIPYKTLTIENAIACGLFLLNEFGYAFGWGTEVWVPKKGFVLKQHSNVASLVNELKKNTAYWSVGWKVVQDIIRKTMTDHRDTEWKNAA